MDQSLLAIMQLQGEIRSIDEEELRKLEKLVAENPCQCERDSECRGLCSVERRLNDELIRRHLKRER